MPDTPEGRESALKKLLQDRIASSIREHGASSPKVMDTGASSPVSQRDLRNDRSYRSPKCKARRIDGQPCRNYAVPGATVCKFHGGSSPQVKRKAALRLAALVEPAITVLAREMATADKSADRQRAANSLLDRAGIVRQSSVDVELAKAMLVDRLKALAASNGPADEDPAAAEGAQEALDEIEQMEAEAAEEDTIVLHPNAAGTHDAASASPSDDDDDDDEGDAPVAVPA